MPISVKRFNRRTLKKFDKTKRKKYSKRNAPSRLRVSATRATVNKQISRALNNYGESKFQGYTESCGAIQAKPAGTQPISYFFYNTGETLTQPGNSMFTPMNLYEFPKGDNATERNGDYMFLKKSHLKIEIQMLPFRSSDLLIAGSSTTAFRVMIVKANRKYNKLGNSPIAGQSLFLTTENDQFGFGVPGGTSTASTFANMRQPINKRKWLVYKDVHFTLSTPSQEYQDTSIPADVQAINAANPKYPVNKLMNIDLPIYKKTHWDPDEVTPDNVDTQWLLVIQAVRTNYCNPGIQAPRNININILGTTSASDS